MHCKKRQNNKGKGKFIEWAWRKFRIKANYQELIHALEALNEF